MCVRVRTDWELGILDMHLVHIISLRTILCTLYLCVPTTHSNACHDLYTHPGIEFDFEVAVVLNIRRVSERERERETEKKRDLGAELDFRVVGVHDEDRDSDRERE